mgnify:CR=1 FL=1
MTQTVRLALLTLLVLATGCAGTYGGTGTRADSLISVQYGTVQAVEPVAMDPNTGTGAALGGVLGLAAASIRSTGTQVGAAAAGAQIGALVQNQRASNRRVNQYAVALNTGGTVAIVTEHHEFAPGHCVSVEQGQHANIRRVSPVMCQAMARPSHPAHAHAHAANVAEASECDQVKQEVLEAQSEDEVRSAYRKMSALREHQASGQSSLAPGNPQLAARRDGVMLALWPAGASAIVLPRRWP